MPPTGGASALSVTDEAVRPAEAEVEAAPRAAPARESTAQVARERMLLRRLRRGDERAFAELVRAFQDRVYSMTLRMLGDAHEAEDLAQEVFVALHGALGTFRGEARLSTWIFRVARNHCLNRLKYLTRRDRGRTSELTEAAESASASEPDEGPDAAVTTRERRELLGRALSTLDEEHRMLVVLRDLEGLSYDEIAAITDQPVGTVKSRLHRSRVALAEAIARMDGKGA